LQYFPPEKAIGTGVEINRQSSGRAADLASTTTIVITAPAADFNKNSKLPDQAASGTTRLRPSRLAR
jgi:hypothetical protein